MADKPVNFYSRTSSVTTEIDEHTLFMFKFDEGDGGTATADSVDPTYQATFYGSSELSAQSRFGASSLRIEPNGNYITFPESSIIPFKGTGDWTVEFWVRFNSDPTSPRAYSIFFVSQSWGTGTWFRMDTANKLEMYCWQGVGGPNFSTVIVPEWLPVVNEWYHIAFCRETSHGKIFINGISQAVIDSSWGTIVDRELPLEIGHTTSVSIDQQIGDFWIDEIRISDIDRYAANFELDKPVNFYSRSGSDMGTAYQFNTMRYFSEVVSSGYGPHLRVPSDWNIGAQDFTISFWVNFAELPSTGDASAIIGGHHQAPGAGGFDTSNGIVLAANSASTAHFWKMVSYSNGEFYTEITSKYQSPTHTCSTGTWYWLVFTRSGSTAAIYENGIKLMQGVLRTDDGDGNYSFNAYPVDPVLIEGFPDPNIFRQIGTSGGAYYNESGSNTDYGLAGTLDDVRVSVGIARYGIPDSIQVPNTVPDKDGYDVFLSHFTGEIGTNTPVTDEVGNSVSVEAAPIGYVTGMGYLDKPLNFYSRSV